jgi:hypothetical protein
VCEGRRGEVGKGNRECVQGVGAAVSGRGEGLEVKLNGLLPIETTILHQTLAHIWFEG